MVENANRIDVERATSFRRHHSDIESTWKHRQLKAFWAYAQEKIPEFVGEFLVVYDQNSSSTNHEDQVTEDQETPKGTEDQETPNNHWAKLWQMARDATIQFWTF